jgi:hypothetical protein
LTCPQNKSIFFDMKSGHASSIPPEWLYLSRLFSALGDEERQRILLSFPPGGTTEREPDRPGVDAEPPYGLASSQAAVRSRRA